MVIAFLDASQIQRAVRLGGDEVAEAIDIESPRLRQIAHAEFDVAGANDVEWRAEVGRANRHLMSSRRVFGALPQRIAAKRHVGVDFVHFDGEADGVDRIDVGQPFVGGGQ